jgi:nucleoside-diphosphate-sugar epimerase
VKVLVLGNLGYVGSVLTTYLQRKGYEVFGLDSGLYEECVLDAHHIDVTTSFKDIRDIQVEDMAGFDAVINLAALSNDPIGELDPGLTFAINRDAAIKSANIARRAKVKRYLFVSSQSIYGISSTSCELEENDLKNPQTAYAQSKWEAEQEIMSMANLNFVTTALRPSTVFGWSPRLRSDIVFNNLLLSGLTKGIIEVHSDGTPWRPIVHVDDLAESIHLTLQCDAESVAGHAFNIGKIDGNYTVQEIAIAASECLGGTEIVFNTENLTDSRTYKVSFKKATEVLEFVAQRDLIESGKEILERIRIENLDSKELLGKLTNRLRQVSTLKLEGKIDGNLRFN